MQTDTCLTLALADVELLQSAYPDETELASGTPDVTKALPITVTVRLSKDSWMDLEFAEGYPVESNISVARYRSTKEHARLEKAVDAVRRTARECLEEGVEGALPCCAAAFEAWNEAQEEPATASEPSEAMADVSRPAQSTDRSIPWITGPPLVDRKSTFQGHLCFVKTEEEVKCGLNQLLTSCTKIQKATHNMVGPVCFAVQHSLIPKMLLYLVGLQIHTRWSKW